MGSREQGLLTYFGLQNVGMWREFFLREAMDKGFIDLLDDLRTQYVAKELLLCPREPKHVFRAFREPKLETVKVIILGQDPYPNRRQAEGLSFSCADENGEIPASLKNIFKELNADLGIQARGNSLSKWASEGVMLLNAVLTTEESKAGQHRGQEGRSYLAKDENTESDLGYGWEVFTLRALKYALKYNPNIIIVAWGRDAKKLADASEAKNVIVSAHPSPLSAHKGFFGSKPFSKINNLLISRRKSAIDWRI